MTPALQYISHKLTERELSVALIVSDHEPYVIPVWPLPKKSQLILAKIIRKACSKYKLEPSWLTALASFSNKCLPKVFDAHRPDDYIVRRSIGQNEVVFSEEGLTLLSIDHTYTFKQLLLTLSKKDWVPHARDVCLSSCVHILNHINEVYTDPKVLKGYLARVFKEVDFKQEEYEEVCSAHSANYCFASIKDVTTVEPVYTALSDIALDWECESRTRAARYIRPWLTKIGRRRDQPNWHGGFEHFGILGRGSTTRRSRHPQPIEQSPAQLSINSQTVRSPRIAS